MNLKITRIIRIVDTRTYEEVADDRWEPIPGSGVENPCARCGRMHEVHAFVELENGTQANVGTGCARGDDLVPAAAFRTAANAAKSLMRLRAKLAKCERDCAVMDEARAKVAAMTAPAPVWALEHWDSGKERPTVRVGDGYAYAFSTPEKLSAADRAEREACALSGWKANRLAEVLPAGVSIYANPQSELHAVGEKIARAEKRLTTFKA